MAVIATSQVLHDGPKNLIMQFTGIGDGGAQESHVVKVDIASLNTRSKRPFRSVKVLEADYEVNGGLLQLEWADTDPVPFLVLGTVGSFCYEEMRGLKNGGSDTANGNIQFTTLGFEAGSNYSILLKMTKKYTP